MIVTNREARQWEDWTRRTTLRRLAKDRQEKVAEYVRQQKTNTPEGASGCSQAVVSHEARASAARGGRAQLGAGQTSALATVSTTAAAPENPGIASSIPHAARDAGLGYFRQRRLF